MAAEFILQVEETSVFAQDAINNFKYLQIFRQIKEYLEQVTTESKDLQDTINKHLTNYDLDKIDLSKDLEEITKYLEQQRSNVEIISTTKIKLDNLIPILKALNFILEILVRDKQYIISSEEKLTFLSTITPEIMKEKLLAIMIEQDVTEFYNIYIDITRITIWINCDYYKNKLDRNYTN